MPAGLTFLGQFLDHDMTFDPTSSLARQQDPSRSATSGSRARPRQSLRGGPVASPHLTTRRSTQAARPSGRGDPGSAAVSIDGVHPLDVPATRRDGADRGSAERREPHRRHSFTWPSSVPQPRRDRLRGRARAPVHPRRELFARGAARGPLALPVAGPSRVPDENRAAPPRRRTFSTQAGGSSRGATRPSFRSSSRSLRTGSATRRSAPATARTSGRAPATRRVSSSGSSSTRRRRTLTTPRTYAAAGAHRAASSTGRPSSTSATDACATTSASTPPFRRAFFHLLGQPAGEPDSLATRNLLRNLTMQVPSGQRIARPCGSRHWP